MTNLIAGTIAVIISTNMFPVITTKHVLTYEKTPGFPVSVVIHESSTLATNEVMPRPLFNLPPPPGTNGPASKVLIFSNLTGDKRADAFAKADLARAPKRRVAPLPPSPGGLGAAMAIDQGGLQMTNKVVVDPLAGCPACVINYKTNRWLLPLYTNSEMLVLFTDWSNFQFGHTYTEERSTTPFVASSWSAYEAPRVWYGAPGQVWRLGQPVTLSGGKIYDEQFIRFKEIVP
jgi:hypothetical protein